MDGVEERLKEAERIWREGKDYELALILLLEMREEFGAHSEVHRQLGLVCYAGCDALDLDDSQELAESAMRRAVELNSDSDESVLALALILNHRKEMFESEVLFRRVVRWKGSPLRSVAASFLADELLWPLARFHEAEMTFGWSLLRDVRDGTLCTRRLSKFIHRLIQHARFEAAETVVQHAMEIEESKELRGLRAEIREAAGTCEDRRAILERCLSLDPSYGGARISLERLGPDLR